MPNTPKTVEAVCGPVIDFTPTTLTTLKKLYNIALKEKKPTFFFGEHEMLTSYAKYLIEHLDTVFKTNEQTQS